MEEFLLPSENVISRIRIGAALGRPSYTTVQAGLAYGGSSE